MPSTVESPGLGKLFMRFGEPCDHVIPKSTVVVSRWANGAGDRRAMIIRPAHEAENVGGGRRPESGNW